MPDLMLVFSRKWKLILGLALIASVVAFIAAILSPKKFLSTATALPANSVIADRARIFNNNIQELYSDFGSPDELDRVEGTAALDTIFIAASREFGLDAHYGLNPSGESQFRAAMRLKKDSKIARSAFGELQVKVWDEDRNMAATLANFLIARISDIHSHIQNESSAATLQQITRQYNELSDQYKKISDSAGRISGPDADLASARKAALLDQVQQYQKMMDQYSLSLQTTPLSLLTVESARASLWPDKPKVVPTVLLSFFAAFLLAFLLAFWTESRKSA
jgi:hypothetical protein